MQDLLSQDEIDALLHGVSDGDVETGKDDVPSDVQFYDLTSQDRIVRGRMPGLERTNERFSRQSSYRPASTSSGCTRCPGSRSW